MECMHANFCGLCLMDVDDIIDYTKHTVAVSLSNESTKEDVESAIAFVRGHIQWANAVIKKGS